MFCTITYSDMNNCISGHFWKHISASWDCLWFLCSLSLLIACSQWEFSYRIFSYFLLSVAFRLQVHSIEQSILLLVHSLAFYSLTCSSICCFCTVKVNHLQFNHLWVIQWNGSLLSVFRNMHEFQFDFIV